MKIKWWGHACFEIKGEENIVIDPHDGNSVGLEKPNVEASIVLVTHDHYDHNATDIVSGNPIKISELGYTSMRGVKINGVKTYHDKSKGERRGENIVYNIDINGINFCHLGDLGHELDQKKIREIGKVDILFVPVGGNFTINAEEAKKVVEEINPSIAIPMHYKVPGLNIPIDRVEKFTELVSNVSRVSNPYNVPKKLPQETKIKVFNP
ncbi:MAG: Zn-dependent hydrolase of the beta-lactamase fold [Candidatus Methanohalarchaeum thermophilum]|uniref:Zn-dependent hydrolase of the beta-lactamase fold n=1 Tax=Methanohalarchaeum thermophilum TaxID=1903181 RepID=A0A1Q6DUE1_METT1|nr:MAG: Zn-dependent hydrolase of the beta-lactamase fold [Candidatus Methanohalarchaeum thermophilum]